MLPRIISKEQSETSALLGALVAIAENQVWLPAPTWLLTTLYNSRSRGSNKPFLASVGTQTHMDSPTHRHTLTQRIKNEIFVKRIVSKSVDDYTRNSDCLLKFLHS